jgi:hypothetical protein
MSSEIKINPEFESLIRPLTPKEAEDLETMIVSHGCRHPIVVWKKTGEIVDGHNRYRICTKLGKEFDVERKTFSNVEAAKHYIIMNQLARRNVTPREAAVYRGMMYNARKKDHGGDRSSAQSEHLRTAEEMAEEFKVAAATIKRDAALAEALEATGQLYDYIAGSIEKSRNAIISEYKKTKPKTKPSATREDKPKWVKVWQSFKGLSHKDQIDFVAHYENHWTYEGGVVE